MTAATLEMLLTDPLAQGAVKVAAACTVFDVSLRWAEVEDVQVRLARLESLMETDAG